MSGVERVSAFVEWLAGELRDEFHDGAAEVHEGTFGHGSQVVVGAVGVEAGEERAGTRRRPWVATVDVFAVCVVRGGSPAEARRGVAAIGGRVEAVVNVEGVRTGGGVCDMSAALVSFDPFPSDDGRGAVVQFAVSANFRE